MSRTQKSKKDCRKNELLLVADFLNFEQSTAGTHVLFLQLGGLVDNGCADGPGNPVVVGLSDTSDDGNAGRVEEMLC